MTHNAYELFTKHEKRLLSRRMTYPIEMRVFMVSNAVLTCIEWIVIVFIVSHSTLSSITVPILYITKDPRKYLLLLHEVLWLRSIFG